MQTVGKTLGPVLAAIACVARGWHVLPIHGVTDSGCSCGNPECHSPGKHPCTVRGLKEAIPRDITWNLKGESAYMVARMGLFEFMHGVLAPLRHNTRLNWTLYLAIYEDPDAVEDLMSQLHDELAEAANKDKYSGPCADDVLPV